MEKGRRSYHESYFKGGACLFYNASDRSCGKKPVFVPEVGYDYWKICDSFQLDDDYASQRNVAFVKRTWMGKPKAPVKNKPQPAQKPAKKPHASKAAVKPLTGKKAPAKAWCDWEITVYDFEEQQTCRYKVIKSPVGNLAKQEISNESLLFKEACKAQTSTEFEVNGYKYRLVKK